jgi:hypothetical protein
MRLSEIDRGDTLANRLLISFISLVSGMPKRDQADPGKDKKKTRRAEAAGLRSAPAV